ncbi:hypothetical protein OAG69_00240 [bacterium]|nr:hypothetical protein [bacterium]
MPDDSTYREDAPTPDPYKGFSEGVDRHRRAIEATRRAAEYDRAARRKVQADQEAEAERIAKQRQTERNSAFQDQAKEEGFGDYTYSDAGGDTQSALTEEQTQALRRENQEEIAREAAKSAAGFRKTDLTREHGRVKSGLLTKDKYEKKLGAIEAAEQNLSFLESERNNNLISSDEYQVESNRVTQELSTLRGEVEADDTARAKAEELQKQIYAQEDIVSGRPDLPTAIPDDPQERINYIDAYNARAKRANAASKNLSLNVAEQYEAHTKRVDQLKQSFDEWQSQGVTPEEFNEAQNVLRGEFAKSQAQYLQNRFDYDQSIKKLEDEQEDLEMLRPYVMDVIQAQNAFGIKTAKEAKEKLDRERAEIKKPLEDKAKDYKRFSKEAAEQQREVIKLLDLPPAKTKEEQDERLSQIQEASDKAQATASLALGRLADGRQKIMAALVNDKGSNEILEAIAFKGAEKRSDGWYVPVVGDGKLTEKFDTTGGAWYENIGNVALGALANTGEFLGQSVYKMQPGTQRVKSHVLNNLQEELGFDDSQMWEMMYDIRYENGEWEAGEKARALSDGKIIFNPSLNILDKETYDDAVKSSGAPSWMVDYMTKESIRNDYMSTYASTAQEDMMLASALPGGMPTPSEWYMEHYGKSGKNPDHTQWMREYLDQYAPENQNFGQRTRAKASLVLRAYSIGGGKVVQMFTGAAAIGGSSNARDYASTLQDQMEEQRRGLDSQGGEFLGSGVVRTLLEEGPSVLLTIPFGGFGGGIAKSAFGQAIKTGALRVPAKYVGEKGAQQYLQRVGTKGALAGSSIGSGFQSLGLSFQHYYDQALKVEEEKKGRPLTEAEKDELVSSPAVRGRSVAAGLLTATITRAFGAQLQSTVLRGMFGGSKTPHTVRDVMRYIKRNGPKGMADAEIKKRLKSSLFDILKSSGIEGLEEATDEFIAAMTLDPEASLESAFDVAVKAGKAGIILGGASKIAMSSFSSGVTSANASDPEVALEALKDYFGNDVDITQTDVEEALTFINYKAGQDGDGDVGIEKLRTAIDTNKQLASQEAEAVSELTRATDAGDSARAKEAQRALDKTRIARAVIKVANGQDVNDLTFTEQKAMKSNLDDGSPVMEMVDGQVVLTDSAINLVAKQNSDAASKLIGLSEGGRRQEIRQQAKERAEATPEETTEETPEATPESAPEATPEATPESATESAPVATPVATPEAEAPKPLSPERAAKKAELRKKAGVTGKKDEEIRTQKGEGYKNKNTAGVRLRALNENPADFNFVEDSNGKIVPVRKADKTTPYEGEAQAASAKPEEATGSSKPKWRVGLQKPGGAVRYVIAEGSTRAKAVAEAVKQARKGETVNPSLAEQIKTPTETEAPAAKKAATKKAATKKAATKKAATKKAATKKAKTDAALYVGQSAELDKKIKADKTGLIAKLFKAAKAAGIQVHYAKNSNEAADKGLIPQNPKRRKQTARASAFVTKDGAFGIVIFDKGLKGVKPALVAQTVKHELKHVAQYLYEKTEEGNANAKEAEQMFDPSSPKYDKKADDLGRKEYPGWDKRNFRSKLREASRALLEAEEDGTLSGFRESAQLKKYVKAFLEFLAETFSKNGNPDLAKYLRKTKANLDAIMSGDLTVESTRKKKRKTKSDEDAEGDTAQAMPATPKDVQFADVEEAISGMFTSIEEAPTKDDIRKMRDDGESKEDIEKAEAKVLSEGASFRLDENGELIIRKDLSREKAQVTLIKALAQQASRKALTESEGESLYSLMPPNLRKMVLKRASKVTGKEVSPSEAAQYLVTHLLTDKTLAATVRAQARKSTNPLKQGKGITGSERKFLGMILRLLRGFTNNVRKIMDRLSTRTGRQQLQFYENLAQSILIDLTDARALSSLGIALPQTRLTSPSDVVLPPNISKKRGGYIVQMPNGRTVTARTRNEAVDINATKFESQFDRDMRIALALGIKQGGLSIEEFEADLKLTKRMVEAVSGKIGLSKEAIYAMVQARFAGGETNSILDAFAKGKVEAASALQQKMEVLKSIGNQVDGTLQEGSITEFARRALAASRASTQIGSDLEGNPAAIESMRAAQRQFIEIAGGKSSKKVLSSLKALDTKKMGLVDRLGALQTEDFLVGEVPTKESQSILDDMAKVDDEIAKVLSGEAFSGAYKKALLRNTDVKGLAGRGNIAGLVAFTEAADAGTVMHEFVHVLQSLSDPRTGKSLLDSALGSRGVQKMEKWIQRVYPGVDEGSYDWNEALAEGMEAWLREGGKEDAELADEFATVAGAVGRVYNGAKDQPGFDLNDDAREVLESLLSLDPVVDNQMQANITRVQQIFQGVSANTKFFGDDMVLPLNTGGMQVGFKKEKPARNLAKNLGKRYEDVRVAQHEGKYYAVITRPGLQFDQKELRIKLIANLQQRARKVKISKVSKARNGFRVGTMLNTSKPAGGKKNAALPELGDNITRNRIPDETYRKHMAKFNYGHLPKAITDITDPDEKRDAAIAFMKDNLIALHDEAKLQLGDDFYRMATQWYDGANKIAKQMAAKYNVSEEQAAGVIAVLSPQRDWFMNLGLAERVLDVLANNKRTIINVKRFGKAMDDIVASASFKETRSPGMTDEQWAKRKRGLAISAKSERRKILNKLKGKSIASLANSPTAQAWAVRVIAHSKFGTDFRVFSPDGQKMHVQRNNPSKSQIKKGELGKPSKIQWGGTGSISDAVSIFEDGARVNISRRLGAEHKVRSFYNNIIAPNSDMGDVTIDTHAVAASHLMPFGASAIEVKHNFGAMGKSNTGVSGGYHLYADAYRQAAAEVGLMPRQMQSITWEAIRLLYPDYMRRGVQKTNLVAKNKSLWQGPFSYGEARTGILRGSKLHSPEWLGRGRDQSAQTSTGKLQKGVSDGSDSGRSSRTGAGRTGRGRGGVQLQGPNAAAVANAEKSLGRNFIAAYDVIRALHGKGKEDSQIVRKETQALREFAEKSGLNFPAAEWMAKWDKTGVSGAEHRVLLTEDGYAEKHTNAPFQKTWKDYFDRLIWHNYFFPETAFEFLGFHDQVPQSIGGPKSSLHVYTRQKAVDIETEKKPDVEKDIIPEMASRGWVPITENLFYHPEQDVLIGDLKAANVPFLDLKGTPDPTLAFLDPMIRPREKGKTYRQEGYIPDILMEQGWATADIPAAPAVVYAYGDGPALQMFDEALPSGPGNVQLQSNTAAQKAFKAAGMMESKKKMPDSLFDDMSGAFKHVRPSRGKVVKLTESNSGFNFIQEYTFLIANENNQTFGAHFDRDSLEWLATPLDENGSPNARFEQRNRYTGKPESVRRRYFSPGDRADEISLLMDDLNAYTRPSDGFVQLQVSPEQDAKYMELAKNPEKNWLELKTMVERRAKAAGFETRTKHATGATFDAFDRGEIPEFDPDTNIRGFHVSNEADTFSSYRYQRTDNKVLDLFVKKGRTVDRVTAQQMVARGEETDGFPSGFDTVVFSEPAGFPTQKQQRDFDQGEPVFLSGSYFVIKGDSALGGAELYLENNPNETITTFEDLDDTFDFFSEEHLVVRSPEQLKSADPVTRDADGNVIPLSQRFDSTSPNIQLSAPRTRADGAARAAKRMKKSVGKALKWKNRDARDAKGEKKVKGDPSRANISTNESVRNAFNVNQEIYNENFINQNWDGWVAGANKLQKATPASDIELQIFRAAEQSGEGATPEFQIVAKRVVSNRLQQAMASGVQSDIDYALELAQAEQEMRGVIARSMAAMRDPFQSPAQRAAYALGTIIHTAPTSQVNALKKKHGGGVGESVPPKNKKAYNDDLRKMQNYRIEQSRKLLEKEGIKLDEIFNAQKEGVGINTKADTETLAKMTEKQSKVVNMVREGFEPKEIKMQTGVSPEGQKKAVEKYRKLLEPKVKNLIERGYTPETIDSYARGEAPPEGGREAKKEDIEEIMSRSFGVGLKKKEGFNINDPRQVMAAARVLDDLDLDWISRTTGSWYANVFSMKTVMVNLMSIPFAGYRMIGERSAEMIVNSLVKNPKNAQFGEFKYMAEGLKTYYAMAFTQGYLAFDTERAYFNAFAKGKGGPYEQAAGESHEDVRGYQMGHLMDYFDIALEKAGVNIKYPNMIRRAAGQKGAMKKLELGKASRGILRFNMGVDEFMRFIIAGTEVGAIAYRLGRSKGLKGDALKEFVKMEMTVQGSSSWEMAADQADISVFTKDLPDSYKNTPKGPLELFAYLANKFDQSLKNVDKALLGEKVMHRSTSDGMSKLTNIARLDAMRVGVNLTRVTLMPFTRVLMNIIREGGSRVPNPLTVVISLQRMWSYMANNRGNPDPVAAKAVSDFSSQMQSMLITYMIYGMVEGDEDDREKFILMTGSMPKFGPQATENKAAAQREGMGPYRIRVGNRTFEYGRIDPLALTLGTTIDLIREFKLNRRGEKDIPESLQTLAFDTVVGQLTDKTMLRGINDTFSMSTGKLPVSKFAARQLTTFIVPNIIRQPLRDTNTYYDHNLSEGGWAGFQNTLLYEMYPNAEDKLGGAIPKNPWSIPPSGIDAYGEKKKRPNILSDKSSMLTPLDWIFRPQNYTPNRFDQTVRREQRRDPGNENIKMPGAVSKKYTYKNPSTGQSESHKMSGEQTEIFHRLYRQFWRQERGSATTAAGIASAKKNASELARAVAMKDPRFLKAAREQSRKKKK